MSDLIIEGLVKNFGRVRAIDNVSLTVKSGTLTTLLGPSGCGKTTTLNSVAGLDPIDEGIIRVGDFVLNDSKRGIALQPEERELGMVFQSYALWPHMKVYDNLAFGLKLKKVSDADCKKRIKEVLELVGLGAMEQRYPYQLSGGQQQRVALARAVVTQPRLLLLDEPLSNLDAKVREQAREWLRELQQRVGITTIYVTHDQTEALAMSDMIAIMSNGRLEQYAPPNEVYEKPASRFVADFIGVTAFVEGHIVDQQQRTVRIKIKGDHVLTTESDRSWSANTAVTIAIRSERIQPSNGHTANVVPGAIRSSTYLGSKWQHTVEAGGGLIKVETLDRIAESTLQLYLPAASIILLPKE